MTAAMPVAPRSCLSMFWSVLGSSAVVHHAPSSTTRRRPPRAVVHHAPSSTTRRRAPERLLARLGTRPPPLPRAWARLLPPVVLARLWLAVGAALWRVCRRKSNSGHVPRCERYLVPYVTAVATLLQ